MKRRCLCTCQPLADYQPCLVAQDDSWRSITATQLTKVDYVLTGLLLVMLLLQRSRRADGLERPPTTIIIYDQTRSEFLNVFGFLFSSLLVDLGLSEGALLGDHT